MSFLTQVVNCTSELNGLFLSDAKCDDEAKYLVIANMGDQVTFVQQVALESWVVNTDIFMQWNCCFNCHIQGDAKAWEWSLDISVLGKEPVPKTRSHQFYLFLTLGMSRVKVLRDEMWRWVSIGITCYTMWTNKTISAIDLHHLIYDPESFSFVL